MPRFFATGGSDSESESDSDREQIIARPAAPAFTVNFIQFCTNTKTNKKN